MKDKIMNRDPFWIPFIALIIISALSFILWKHTVIGRIILLFIFILVYKLRIKYYNLDDLIGLLFWIGAVIIILCLFGLTLASRSDQATYDNTSKDQSQNGIKPLNYSKKFNLPDDKGEYEVSLTTLNNSYDIKITIVVPSSILPSDFIWDPAKAPTYVVEGTNLHATDRLDVFLCSSDDTIKPYQSSNLGPAINGKGMLTPTFNTSMYVRVKNIDELLDFTSKYDQLKLIRYNTKAVGIKDFEKNTKDLQTSLSFGYNAEKGYTDYPPLLKIEIPWSEILRQIGLKS